MATKSILKSINIRDKKSAKKFILALECAERKKAKAVTIDRKVRDATEADINELAKKLVR